MPTSKLWLEHTERAAWDSVEALRERLLRAETRLQALAGEAGRLPQLLDVLDEAKLKFAPDAKSHDEIVAQLLKRIEQLQSAREAPPAREPQRVTFIAPPVRPRLDSEDLDAAPRRGSGDDDFDLVDFAQAMQRRADSAEPTLDLNRLLTLIEHKVDDLSELEGAALREAAVELGILAAKIYGTSRPEV